MKSEESIFELLNPEVVSKEEGRVAMRFPVQQRTTIPGGQVQGGIVCSMLDMAMAFAKDGGLSTASIQVELLRPATGAYLDVVGQVTQSGRRIIFAEAEMRDDQGRMVARGRQTAVPLPDRGFSQS
ncbi:MAG: PaaI family thioesterase [Myxococcota bacterium]|nr:hypothetical protein [Deltaproteobacteria bacterium]MCP4240066.1 PaaI family thioesterase [bacterium]MDP6076087.1 PaaI family thioesterase [Myxococcota bacterium]MDP6244039.1 PaaI family thioesterase [Myxococcota bacterium]MDP7073565.1 PaaI family thioesterase [Myxococcota bacterium]